MHAQEENPQRSRELISAELMVTGFIKAWPWYAYQKALMDAFVVYPEKMSFLPDQVSFRGSTPVRAFVGQNWPKLNAYLDGSAPEEKNSRPHHRSSNSSGTECCPLGR